MTATTITTICPHCRKWNALADQDGAVDGPREYHAACWVAASEWRVVSDRETAVFLPEDRS